MDPVNDRRYREMNLSGQIGGFYPCILLQGSYYSIIQSIHKNSPFFRLGWDWAKRPDVFRTISSDL